MLIFMFMSMSYVVLLWLQFCCVVVGALPFSASLEVIVHEKRCVQSKSSKWWTAFLRWLALISAVFA